MIKFGNSNAYVDCEVYTYRLGIDTLISSNSIIVDFIENKKFRTAGHPLEFSTINNSDKGSGTIL